MGQRREGKRKVTVRRESGRLGEGGREGGKEGGRKE
jgi:hypothetical protein